MEAVKGSFGTFATGNAGSAPPAPRITEHPLQKAEMTFHQRQDQLEMALLQRSQGIHLPLRLQAERKCLSKVGHLPILRRHEASLEALTGRDELIGFEDFLGHPVDSETMVQPHVMAERTGFF